VIVAMFSLSPQSLPTQQVDDFGAHLDDCAVQALSTRGGQRDEFVKRQCRRVIDSEELCFQTCSRSRCSLRDNREKRAPERACFGGTSTLKTSSEVAELQPEILAHHYAEAGMRMRWAFG
jgi:hypothetical protein